MRDIHSHHDSPRMTAILAMSVDGKISSTSETAAKFSTQTDLQHLEEQIALCDAIVFGASTLRAYGTTITVKNPNLLKQRQHRYQSIQPLNIVCSSSGNINPHYPFFCQSVNRALLTTNQGLRLWRSISHNLPQDSSGFEHIIISENLDQQTINWQTAITKFKELKLKKIAVLGGAKLLSSLLAENLIDDLWLTVCPIIFGNNQATNLINQTTAIPIELELLDYQVIDSEIFLHYQIKK